MRTGKNIVELAQEINRLGNLKQDLIADTRELHLAHTGELLVGDQSLPVNSHAHRQIAARLGIPAKYYDRMRQDAPQLLADNVNEWFTQEPERRMLRTLDGNVRAFLSDRYRRIDNEDVAEAVLPLVLDQAQAGNLEIVSAEITDTRMYLQATFPKVVGEVKQGDVVQSGFILRNSEIGAGSFSLDPLIYRLVCLNGMVRTDGGLKKYHVGRRAETQDGSFEIFSEETQRLDDAALMAKIRDLVTAFSNQEVFDQTLERMRAAAQSAEIAHPTKAIEVLTKRGMISGGEGESVLANLIRGGDLSQWGLVNAVTAQAHHTEDYDRSVEFEELGGKVLDLNPSQWREIAEAA